MGHDVKSIRQQFRERGVFYSDERMARLLMGFMPDGLTEVYDPTCGDGGLLWVFGDEVRKYGQELDAEQAGVARGRLVNCEIAAGDTLMSPAFADRRFRGIVANPPFSVKWTAPAHPEADPVFRDAPCLPPPSKGDYAFLLHIIHCLADDGVAAVVNAPGVCYRGQREGRLRRWLIERNLIERVIQMESGYFVDTKLATVVIVFRKGRATTGIVMRDEATGIEREVSVDEIAANNYSLNVSAYVSAPEPERPAVNPVELESRGREAALKRMRAELEFSSMVAQFEGWSLTPMLDAVDELVREFRARTGANH